MRPAQDGLVALRAMAAARKNVDAASERKTRRLAVPAKLLRMSWRARLVMTGLPFGDVPSCRFPRPAAVTEVTVAKIMGQPLEGCPTGLDARPEPVEPARSRHRGTCAFQASATQGGRGA